MAESRFQLWSALENIIKSPSSLTASYQPATATAPFQHSSSSHTSILTASANSSRRNDEPAAAAPVEQPKSDTNTENSWLSDDKAAQSQESEELSKRKSPDSLYAIVSQNLKSSLLSRSTTMSTPSQPTSSASNPSGSSAPTANSQPQDQSEEISKRLNGLRPSESLPNRLKSFEELIKIGELFNLNENSINILLQSTFDLYQTDQTPLEYRKQAFDYLIQFIQKKYEKFDTFMLRNVMLTLVHNSNLISPPTAANLFQQQQSLPVTNCDDIKYRFNLFNLIVKGGTNFKNVDHQIAYKCLIFFFKNSQFLTDRTQQIFELFTNIIANKHLIYLDDDLLVELTKFILNFSFNLTKNLASASINSNSTTLRSVVFTKQQQIELKCCVELIDKVIGHIAKKVCVSHLVLCLCELLDLTWQSQSNRLEGQTNRPSDGQSVSTSNEVIINQIYECMQKLFVSPIGNCALFSFFGEIFAPNKKHPLHRNSQINGAIMHIKQIFEEYKQSKFKNTAIIKELHYKTMLNLPNLLKSYSKENQQLQSYIYEQTLNLAIDLIYMTNRDVFMSLQTFSSKTALNEVLEEVALKMQNNEVLLKKYADLLNLIDKKDLFAYKTPTNLPPAMAGSVKENDDAIVAIQLKDKFYDHVHRYPRTNLLKEQCVNNCIEYYLQRKIISCYDNDSVKQIKSLLDKYFKNCQNSMIRKFLIEALQKKLNDFEQKEKKIFKEKILTEAILPLCEIWIQESTDSLKTSPTTDGLPSPAELDVIEMKSFVVTKLMELSSSSNEETILRIILILESMILSERLNADLAGLIAVSSNAHTPLTGSTNSSPLPLSSASSSILSPTPSQPPSANLIVQKNNYLTKAISSLIQIFEKHFKSSFGSGAYTECLIKIYDILVKYLERFYSTMPIIGASLLANAESAPASSMTSSTSSSILTGFSSSNLKRTTSSVGNANAAGSEHQQQSTPSVNNARLMSLYASTRFEVFEFLLRIKSSLYDNRMHLINRLDRKKSVESKYLLLAINDPNASEVSVPKAIKFNCQLDYGKVLRVIELCLERETDPAIVLKVLSDLPYVIQFEMDLIQRFNKDFIKTLFGIVKHQLNMLKNKPELLKIEAQTRQEYNSKYHFLLASLMMYHSILQRSGQEYILQHFISALGSSKYCLEALIIAISEMPDVSSQCPNILLRLTQFTPSQNMAQPVLEILSTLSDLRRLDTKNFSDKDFITVPATAVKYMDPLKFNSFVILLAHYVTCVWFIKCKPEYRRKYAMFVCKGLNQEVITQLNKASSILGAKDSAKSPNKAEVDAANKQPSGNTPSSEGRDGGIYKVSTLRNQNALSENMRTFYKELVDITMDFMANNMFFNTNNTQLGTLHNQNELIVDIFSNSSKPESTARHNSIFDSAVGKDSKGLTRSWIMGNKIIQITTGLFSGICNKEITVQKPRNQRISISKDSVKSSIGTGGGNIGFVVNSLGPVSAVSRPKMTPTAAMNIPNSSGHSNLAVASSMASTTTNDSVASSASSTGNINNSISSPGLLYDQAAAIGEGHLSLKQITSSTKPEQDFFDETLDGSGSGAVNRSDSLGTSGSNLHNDSSLISATQEAAGAAGEMNDVLEAFNKDILGESTAFESKKKQSKEAASGKTGQRVRKNILNKRFKSTMTGRAEDDCYLLEDGNDSYGNRQSKLAYLSCSKDDSDISSASSLCMKNLGEDFHRNGILTNVDRSLNQYQTDGPHMNYSSSKTSQLNTLDSLTTKQEICHPSCWCNNLVEIICKCPTKVINYITLFENNTSSSHELNLSSISSIIQQQLQSNLIENNKLILPTSSKGMPTIMTGKDVISTFTSTFKSSNVLQNLVGNVNPDPRSSLLLSELSPADSPARKKSTAKQIDLESSKENSKLGPIDIAELQRNREISSSGKKPIARKSSFDSSDAPKADLSNQGPQDLKRPNNLEKFGDQASASILAKKIIQIQPMVSATQLSTTPIDPSQVFLQLFETPRCNENEQPIMIPDIPSIQRSIFMLDFTQCYLIHRIGVLYIGNNQAHDEKAILSNTNGSFRYKQFINGLGNLIRLKDMNTHHYYRGDLEIDGSAGEFTLLWFDGIAQVIFHVVTMMPNSTLEENTNFKKKHIGNDSTLIVYNESGEEYQFGWIKGEVNCVCIEIEPLKSNTNIVKMKVTSDLTSQTTSAANSPWIAHQEPKFISDSNLAYIVRKMALHADLASRVCRNQKDDRSIYGGKWYERLKQINRIRKMSLEHIANQQLPKPGTPSQTARNTLGSSPTPNPAGSQLDNVLDFTNYI